jgi:hypothetical protein
MKKHKPKKKQELRHQLALATQQNIALREKLAIMRPMFESRIYAVQVGSNTVPLMTSSVHLRNVAVSESVSGMDIVEMASGKVVGHYDFPTPVTLTAGDSFDIQVDLRKETLAAAEAPAPAAEPVDATAVEPVAQSPADPSDFGYDGHGYSNTGALD